MRTIIEEGEPPVKFHARSVLRQRRVLFDRRQSLQLITHHFALNDVMKAYDTFADATNQRALKVIITNA